MHIMNDLFINGLRINWDEIDDDSYLKEIESIKKISELWLANPITFSSEKMVVANQRF